MRWVFVGIVALNLLYLAWSVASEEAPVHAAADVLPEEREFPGTVALLAESGVREPAVAPAPPTVSGCPAIGPLADSDREAAKAALAAAGYVVNESLNAGSAAPAYWVHIPPYPSRAQALRHLRELHAKSIDSFVVGEGPDANAISLGTFSARDSALGVQARLQAAGYVVEVRTQMKQGDATGWLVMADPAAQGFLEFLPKDVQGKVRTERHACPRKSR